MVRNRESELLARTFKDRLTVYRMELVRDPKTQGTVERESIVYEDIVCALSQGSNSTPEREEFHSDTQQSYVLFTMPGIELKDNDKAVVTTEAGQTFEGFTGRTFGYISHGETPFKTEKTT